MARLRSLRFAWPQAELEVLLGAGGVGGSFALALPLQVGFFRWLFLRSPGALRRVPLAVLPGQLSEVLVLGGGCCCALRLSCRSVLVVGFFLPLPFRFFLVRVSSGLGLLCPRFFPPASGWGFFSAARPCHLSLSLALVSSCGVGF